MSDKRKKRYYWLKLKEDFFEEDTIAWLEEQENGKEYSLIYLKMCLKSLKTDGLLARNVGEMIIPYDEKAIAKITNSSVDTVIVALSLFKKIGLVKQLDTGELFIQQISEMVGNETESARQKRLERAKSNNVLAIEEQEVRQCRKNVAQSIELEKEKELEIRDINTLATSDEDRESFSEYVESATDLVDKLWLLYPKERRKGKSKTINWLNNKKNKGKLDLSELETGVNNYLSQQRANKTQGKYHMDFERLVTKEYYKDYQESVKSNQNGYIRETTDSGYPF